jgi:tetratricopeptide (TPR) repeat protein
MERLQISETPSIPLQDRQAANSQEADIAWYWLPSRVNWRWFARYGLIASALFVIVLIMIHVSGLTPDQRAIPRNESIVNLTAAIEYTPYDAALYWMLGDAYFDQENYHQALANYHRYLELAPDNPPQRLLQRLDYLEFHAQTGR